MRIALPIILIAALAVAVGFCIQRHNTVTGTITFEGDQSIPAGAVLTVELRDVSYQDAPSTLIASQTIPNPQRFPIDFAIRYQPSDIDPRATYGLGIRVTLNDRLIYINDTAFDVLTRGNPTHGLNVWVIAVDAP
ncbi:MAG: YbaY family lipoprotein [Chloroflexota bacterium]|nr:YbaY family lipoprotein [Chloroflexota bacterium]MDE2918484.1 YbaY family lipoprotein [Chloroflexota bacterium]